MSRREGLRQRLAQRPILMAPGVFDALSARIVEHCGFEAVYASGGAIARSLGFPDLGLVAMPEMAERIALICEATALPVIADADTGYGNALNVHRTVREWERAGVAALHLEDQVTPKRCGHYEGKALIPADEMVGKLRAAVEARQDETLIIARTDARATEGLNGALARARAYKEAGADVLFVEAPESLEEIRTIARSLPGPLMINIFAGGKTPPVPIDRLDEMGYRIAIFPSDLQRAAIFAMIECGRHLRSTGTVVGFGPVVSFQDREALVNSARWASMAERYGAPPHEG